MTGDFIEVKGASEHNLKNISLKIPKNKLVVVTGISGSGKSSLAFDTLYAEGQRRYVESLSSYARQFLHMRNKPNVEMISGLSPAIAIDQRGMFRTPRSTVGTVTEIYDYLRLLYARIGIPHSPATGLPIESQPASKIVESIASMPEGTRINLLAPIVRGEKGEHQKEISALRRQGFQQLRIDRVEYPITSLPTLDKNKRHVIELVVASITISSDTATSLSKNVETALKHGNGVLGVEIIEDSGKNSSSKNQQTPRIFSEKFCCPVSGFQIDEIEPRIFSFNGPYGACPHCHGLGVESFFDQKLIIPNPKLSINEGAIAPWEVVKSREQLDLLSALSAHYKFNLDWPFSRLSKEIQDLLFEGLNGQKIEVICTEGLYKTVRYKEFKGIIGELEERIEKMPEFRVDDVLAKFKSEGPCKVCNGYRLKPESLCVQIAGKHIGHVSNMPLRDALNWFKSLPTHLDARQNEIADKIIQEILSGLQCLIDVGVDYLTLARRSDSISGGESQRIRLASQIGSGLSGVLYVLDEPSIGLHQRDNIKLIATLRKLVDLNNTVIVVEHDEETICAADHIIDIGPGAGIKGGKIMGQGSLQEILREPSSLTGLYLSGQLSIPIPKVWRKGSGKKIVLRGARLNNLKNVSIEIPLGTFTTITGVSGSGKSSLIMDTLYEASVQALNANNAPSPHYDSLSGLEYLDRAIEITQSPIGRTPRSNPATYIGAFSLIREWFARLPESQARGYALARFSFNVKGGRCEACQGDGLIKMEMHLLPDVYVECEECLGQRYNKPTLEIKHKGKSIADVLNMTVEDATIYFADVPAIKCKLDVMMDVGLGYIKLGQPATSLSGGEAQRIKLAKELSKQSTGATLYILDEPTTGLHMEDIGNLLKVLHRLVDMGNTLVVIEHNMHVIKTSDYIIDMGPEGGGLGGQVVAFGPPHKIVESKASLTGQYLGKYLQQHGAPIGEWA